MIQQMKILKPQEKATESAVEKISKAMRALEDVEVPKSVEIPKELPKQKVNL